MARLRLVVLVSGRGSNLESLIRASRERRLEADVALVLSNKADAPALDVAARAGVPAFLVPSAGLPRDAHESQLRARIDAAHADLVCLAGYMRVLTPAFIRAYEGRLLNIHPSLLPAFPGVDAPAQAVAHGALVSGATVHFVTDEVDGGPILAQAAVALPPGCSVDEARERILAAEHELYPRALQLLATGAARLEGGRVLHKDDAKPQGAIFSP